MALKSLEELISTINFEKLKITGVDKTKLIKEIEIDKKYINDNFNKAELNPPIELANYFEFVDLVMSNYFRLGLSCLADKDETYLWPREQFLLPSANTVLAIMAINVFKSLRAVRSLILLENDSQARIVARSLFEYLDLINAALCDLTVFKCYLYSHEDYSKQYQNWRKHLSPKKVREILNDFENNFQIEGEVKEELSSFRENTYQWLSQFTHANWPAQVVSALGASENIDIDKLAKDEVLDAKYLLINLCVYLHNSGLLLDFQLREIHNWTSDSEFQKGFLTASTLTRRYFLDIYPWMLEDVKD